MVFRPRDEDEVYESLRGRLTGKIEALTNFVRGSFNDVWTRAFSQEIRENEIQASAAQLSGWVEYAGGPITQSDLDDLGIDNVSPEEINEFVDDQDLDELARIVGIRRDEGVEAVGEVTFTTVEAATVIPAGTEVGTQPDSRGEFLSYETTESVNTDTGETEVTAEISATQVGERFNVGAQTITFLPSPPGGVQAVINTESITGGVDRESNSELRERTKEAVFATSGGGTTSGIIGYIQQNTEARDILIEEFTDEQPPSVDVIVDGGDDEEVKDAIASSRPVGIQHNFVRPTNFTVSIEVDVTGTNINTARIADDLTEFVNGLAIGDDLFRNKVFQIVFNSDEDVDNTVRADILIIGDQYTYETETDVYDLEKGSIMDQDDTVREIRGTLDGTTGHVFEKGVDYDVVDSTSDGNLNAIDWSVGGESPDDGTDFFVDYVIDNDIPFETREKAIAGVMDVTVV